MRIRLMMMSVLLGLAVSALPAAAAVAAHWEGVLVLPSGEVPIVVDLGPGAEGGWRGQIDIRPQGIVNLALSAISEEAGAVSFALPGIPGNPVFRGTLAEDGGSIAGNLEQTGRQFPFRLERKGEPLWDHVADDGVRLVEQGRPGEGPAGEWHGVLIAGPSRLRLIVRITAGPDGTFAATLDSIDQGRSGIPVDEVLWGAEDRDVGLDMGSIGAGFTGQLSADGSEIVGAWEQGPASLPLTFKRK